MTWLRVFSLWALMATTAHAHKSSDAYLSLTSQGAEITGHWDIALRDLDMLVPLDANNDGQLTAGEVRAASAKISRLLHTQFRVQRASKPCALSLGDMSFVEHSDGVYLRHQVQGMCSTEGSYSVNYRLLRDIDAQHRGMLSLRVGTETSLLVLDPALDGQALLAPSLFEQASAFATEGWHHVLRGFDHLMFVALLVVAAVLRHAGAMRSTARELLGVITAFTVAHSLTLALATFEVLRLPTRWVETAIAASIVVTAIDLLRPFLPGPRWALAFGFGLVHGLGFASSLSALNSPQAQRLGSLLGFNLGIELGQLLVAAVACLLLVAALRVPVPVSHWLPRLAGLPAVAIGGAWMLERALDQKWLPW